jgi:pimeloyl-ACP methyl ester carboxylesterase
MNKLFCLLIALSVTTLVSAANLSTQYYTTHGTKFWTTQGGHGKPPVILLSAAGQPQTTWHAVLPGLSQITHVFTYDRAGLGKSQSLEDLVSPRSAKYVVQRLRDLLTVANVKPPYVLVSSGVSSSYARYFARNFSNEVVGLLLINPRVDAAIALGRIKNYAPGENHEQVKFRQQYNHNILVLKRRVLGFNANEAKLSINVSQAALIEHDLEQLGQIKSEQQLMLSPPLKPIALIVMEGKKDSPLETNMLQQLVASTPRGQYEYTPLHSDDLQKFAPQKIVAAVRQLLRHR